MTNKHYQKWLKINDSLITQKLQSLPLDKIEVCFGKSLIFSSSGVKGIMELGTIRINEVTICKLAYSVLAFCKKNKFQSVVVGYDARRNSKAYYNIFVKILANGGIIVNAFKQFVPTPILAFSVNYTKSNLGIMITASHSYKDYNGVKFFNFQGIQISDEYEKELEKQYLKLDEIQLFNEYIKIKKYPKNNVKWLKNDEINAFLGNFYKNKINSALNIIYTPLNGTAYSFVKKALKGTGFAHIITPRSQMRSNGEFKTCPYPNPEFLKSYKESLKKTDMFDADVIVATDPDGDGFGAMIKSTKGYKLLTENEVSLLLLNYIHENKPKAEQQYAIASIVSSPLFFDICDTFNIKYEKTLTGSKNIGLAKKSLESKYGKDGFVLSYDDGCGYIVKDNLYDNEGILSLLRFCEMASFLKNAGSSVEEYLNKIYEKFGNIYSVCDSIAFDKVNALDEVEQAMNKLRQNGIKTLLKKKIIKTVDYYDNKQESSNIIQYMAKDFIFIIKPCRAEQKIKIYVHAKGRTLDECKRLASDVEYTIKKEVFNYIEA